MSFLSALISFWMAPILVSMKVKTVTVSECSLQWWTHTNMYPAALFQSSSNSRPASVCLSDSSPFYSVSQFIQFILNHLPSFTSDALLTFPNVHGCFAWKCSHALAIQYSLQPSSVIAIEWMSSLSYFCPAQQTGTYLFLKVQII